MELDLLQSFMQLNLGMTVKHLLGVSAGSQLAGLTNASKIGASATPGKAEDMTYEEAYDTYRKYLTWRAKLGSLYWLADGPTVRLVPCGYIV